MHGREEKREHFNPLKEVKCKRKARSWKLGRLAKGIASGKSKSNPGEGYHLPVWSGQ